MRTFAAAAAKLPSQVGAAAGPQGMSLNGLPNLHDQATGLVPPPTVSLTAVRPSSGALFPSQPASAQSLATTGVVSLPRQERRQRAQRQAAVAALEAAQARAAAVGRASTAPTQTRRGRSASSRSLRRSTSARHAATFGSFGSLSASTLPTPSPATLAAMSDNTDYDMQQWLSIHPPGPKQPTHAQLIDGGDQVKRFDGTAPTDMSESAVVQMCVPASPLKLPVLSPASRSYLPQRCVTRNAVDTVAQVSGEAGGHQGSTPPTVGGSQ